MVPAGQFTRVRNEASGQTLVLADSFEHIEQTPVAPWLIPLKIFDTLTSRSIAQIIFFIVILSGAFELITQAIGIESLSKSLAKAFRKNSFLMCVDNIIFGGGVHNGHDHRGSYVSAADDCRCYRAGLR